MTNILILNALFVGGLGLLFSILGQNTQSRVLGVLLLLLMSVNLYGLVV